MTAIIEIQPNLYELTSSPLDSFMLTEEPKETMKLVEKMIYFDPVHPISGQLLSMIEVDSLSQTQYSLVGFDIIRQGHQVFQFQLQLNKENGKYTIVS